MHFTIRIEATGGLRVIEEIPDLTLSQLEGRNGIGKSLAVRLLQLATGEQPYELLPRAWSSLRSELDWATIRVDHLDGAGHIEWTFTPEAWPERAESIGPWLGAIRIDGREASLDDIRRLIKVSRVAGDESLTDTIAEQVIRDRQLVARARSTIEARQSSLADRVESVLADLALARYDRFAEATEERAGITANQRALRLDYDGLERRRNQVTEAQELADRLRRVASEVPAIDERVSDLAAKLAELETRIHHVEALRAVAMAAMEREAELAGEIAAVERRLASRRAATQRLLVRAAQLASQHGLPSESDVLDGAVLELRSELSRLTAERASVDATPRLRSLSTRLASELEQGTQSGLGHHTIARLHDLDVSAGELRVGLEVVRRELAERSDSVAGRKLDAQIAARQHQQVLVRQAVDLLATIERRRHVIEGDEAELATLTDRLGGNEGRSLTELNNELASLRHEQANAAAERAGLIQSRTAALGKETAASLAAQLHIVLATLGAQEMDLAVELDSIERRLTELENARIASEQWQADLEVELSDLRRAGGRVFDLLSESAPYSWLRDRPEVRLPAKHLTAPENAARARRLLQTLTAVIDLLGRVRTAPSAIEGGLEQLESSVRRSSSHVSSLVPAMRRFYEEEFASFFRRPEIAEALFDDGRFVRLDLARAVLEWATPDGEMRTRPLEAFSSGERVFAYTLARLEGITFEDIPNHLLVLDEFGAFVARDRFDRLVHFLKERILGRRADQVIVILPLSQDYEAEALIAEGPLAEILARHAADIRESGYFVEPLIQ